MWKNPQLTQKIHSIHSQQCINSDIAGHVRRHDQPITWRQNRSNTMTICNWSS